MAERRLLCHVGSVEAAGGNAVAFAVHNRPVLGLVYVPEVWLKAFT